MFSHKAEPTPRGPRTIEPKFPDSERKEIAQKASFLCDPIVPLESRTTFKDLAHINHTPTRKSGALKLQKREPSPPKVPRLSLQANDVSDDKKSPLLTPISRKQMDVGNSRGTRSFLRKKTVKTEVPAIAVRIDEMPSASPRKKLPRGVTFNGQIPQNSDGSPPTRPKLPRGATFNYKASSKTTLSEEKSTATPRRRLPRAATFGKSESVEPVPNNGYPGRVKKSK